jgi:hypothetical protein
MADELIEQEGPCCTCLGLLMAPFGSDDQAELSLLIGVKLTLRA